MTWLKLSDDFPDECARQDLSDAAFRLHVEMLCWTMRKMTGGWIDERDVRRGSEVAHPASPIEELVDCGMWTTEDDHHWHVVHHMDHQPTPEVILRRRELQAKRQQLHREKKARLSETAG